MVKTCACLLLLAVVLTFGNAFVPTTTINTRPVALLTAPRTTATLPVTRMFGFLGDKERESLTRDSEPEDFFATNTDKMSDKEKIPIAIVGVAFITLPFIAGLIALYAAK